MRQLSFLAFSRVSADCVSQEDLHNKRQKTQAKGSREQKALGVCRHHGAAIVCVCRAIEHSRYTKVGGYVARSRSSTTSEQQPENRQTVDETTSLRDPTDG